MKLISLQDSILLPNTKEFTGYQPYTTVVYVKGEANYPEKDSQPGKHRYTDKELLGKVTKLLLHQGLVCWRLVTC